MEDWPDYRWSESPPFTLETLRQGIEAIERGWPKRVFTLRNSIQELAIQAGWNKKELDAFISNPAIRDRLAIEQEKKHGKRHRESRKQEGQHHPIEEQFSPSLAAVQGLQAGALWLEK